MGKKNQTGPGGAPKKKKLNKQKGVAGEQGPRRRREHDRGGNQKKKGRIFAGKPKAIYQ